MAETDWGLFGSSADSVARGVTAGFTPPNGGGNFVFGFNAKVADISAVGLYYQTGTDFDPLRDDSANATGCSIRGALKRATSPSPLGFSVALFGCLQGATIDDYGYMLGLSNDDPHYIILAKTTLKSKLSSDSTNTLRISTESFVLDTWVHLRLDIIVNPNGDVVLRCYKNDLDAHTVSSPTWEAISGMDTFVDDALGINTSSTGMPQPMSGGYVGYGFASEALQARGMVDYVEVFRQK